MEHSCIVDKHIQTFPGGFYEAMARLWKVLNLSYENVKAKIATTYQIFCLEKNSIFGQFQNPFHFIKHCCIEDVSHRFSLYIQVGKFSNI